MKERAIDVIKEGLQDDKRIIQFRRDLLLMQRINTRQGHRRSVPYKFPKLLPSRKLHPEAPQQIGSGISSLPWRRSPPKSIVSAYFPASSVRRSESPPKTPPGSATPYQQINRGPGTPNGTPIVTIDLSDLATRTRPHSSSSTHSAPSSPRAYVTRPLFRRPHSTWNDYANHFMYANEDDFDEDGLEYEDEMEEQEEQDNNEAGADEAGLDENYAGDEFFENGEYYQVEEEQDEELIRNAQHANKKSEQADNKHREKDAVPPSYSKQEKAEKQKQDSKSSKQQPQQPPPQQPPPPRQNTPPLSSQVLTRRSPPPPPVVIPSKDTLSSSPPTRSPPLPLPPARIPTTPPLSVLSPRSNVQGYSSPPQKSLFSPSFTKSLTGAMIPSIEKSGYNKLPIETERKEDKKMSTYPAPSKSQSQPQQQQQQVVPNSPKSPSTGRSTSPPKQAPLSTQAPPATHAIASTSSKANTNNNNYVTTTPSSASRGNTSPLKQPPVPQATPQNSKQIVSNTTNTNSNNSNTKRTSSPAKQIPPARTPTPQPEPKPTPQPQPQLPPQQQQQQQKPPTPTKAKVASSRDSTNSPIPEMKDPSSISVISLAADKVKSGFVLKQEGQGMAISYPRKYAVLTKSGLLYYFRSAVDFATSGCTNLVDFKHVEIPQDPKNRYNFPKFTFKLSNPETAAAVYLAAENKKDMESWMNTITQFIDQAQKAELSPTPNEVIPRAKSPPKPIPMNNAINNNNQMFSGATTAGNHQEEKKANKQSSGTMHHMRK